MSLFIGIIVGIYLLTWLRSDYLDAFERQLRNVDTKYFTVTSTMLWLAFVSERERGGRRERERRRKISQKINL